MGIAEVHDFDRLDRIAVVIDLRPDDEHASEWIVGVRLADFRLVSSPLCGLGEQHETREVDIRREIDIRGGTNVAVHAERVRVDQSRLDSQVGSESSYLLSELDAPAP